MTAKLVAQRCQKLRCIAFILTADEARHKRQRDDGRGNVEVDGFLYGPASLTAIGDPALNVAQGGICFQGPGGQIQEPGTNDTAVAPDFGNLMAVQGKLLFSAQDFEALGISLHQAVLNAVVDHLDEMPGAGWANVSPALIG